MALEYVTVTFPTRRLVYIDGERSGHTNEILRVDTGTHLFTLGRYANYAPASQAITVTETTVLEPLEIVFTREVVT